VQQIKGAVLKSRLAFVEEVTPTRRPSALPTASRWWSGTGRRWRCAGSRASRSS